MKTFNWQALPSSMIQEADSMWAHLSSGDESVDPNYFSTEQQFCLSRVKTNMMETAPAVKQPKKVTFLDFKKSLSLNIFLKQLKCSPAPGLLAFHHCKPCPPLAPMLPPPNQETLQEPDPAPQLPSQLPRSPSRLAYYLRSPPPPPAQTTATRRNRRSNEEIVDMILKGDVSKFDTEILKQLLKILPEKHEIENLKSYQAEKDKLANIDQFCLLLLEIPGLQLRTECMLLCEEVPVILEMLRPQSQLILAACESLLASRRLPVFCRMILKLGNFLNYGKDKGNASGFKINSLLKLADVKGNQPCVTLLHHILEGLEEKHSDLLRLPDDLESSSRAAGISIGNLHSEISINLLKLREAMQKMSSRNDDIKEQFAEVIQDRIHACEEMDRELQAIEKKRKRLVEYFSEDPQTFSLQNLFTTMKSFRELFIKAHKENREKKERAVRSGKRKRHEETSAKRRKGEAGKIIIDGKRVGKLEGGGVAEAALLDVWEGHLLQNAAEVPCELGKSLTSTETPKSSAMLAATVRL
ncbi:inverted formin-2-like isoform X2 [Rhinatrema bivittatum]|uniref:inverted formin-2-like isoform X2 n=1 Tax=Rhinatrema bivittatum TaxID=194408 RepID=UPI00112ADBCC|nr:inverted formin-2-like isoform X2 [Rhinatrema bivittatum]